LSDKGFQTETVVLMRRKIASFDDGRRRMAGDLRRKATALPRRSYLGMIEHKNGWVCGSVRRQMEQSGILPWSEGAGYKVCSMDRRSRADD
jgi:hypothetical protein